MVCLDEIASIANILKTTPASTVQLLHKIVNDEPYKQLTDDEDEDSAPFLLESTNDANKQPLTPPIYHLPSPQDVFVPLLQTQRNQSQRGNEENTFRPQGKQTHIDRAVIFL
ncbi:hypothetical protein TNCV_3187781 [Trichonephila clavipes]|nr:hypothetical protein TNCV_3187781 [Trichonephila clavipes]